MEIKTVPVTREQSVKWRLDTRDFQQTLLRIGFACASVAIGAVITYFKETILPGVSDEAIFAGIVTLVIGLLEAGKRAVDGPSQQVAQSVVMHDEVPKGYVRAEGVKKVS